MIKVLFICHGNICRSPMAEFVMKDMLEKQGLSHHFHVASAATSRDEIWNGTGNPVYPPAREELAKHGIGCQGKRAVQVTKKDYDRYDYLICMDTNNLRNISRIIGADKEKKVSLLLDYTDRPGASIADPWYTRDFETTYRDVKEGCTGLLQYLLDKED
ncbi:MAG: low molecular weight protein-tyrosine-phosphatase [Lachnospiraceae bacterium]